MLPFSVSTPLPLVDVAIAVGTAEEKLKSDDGVSQVLEAAPDAATAMLVPSAKAAVTVVVVVAVLSRPDRVAPAPSPELNEMEVSAT